MSTWEDSNRLKKHLEGFIELASYLALRPRQKTNWMLRICVATVSECWRCFPPGAAWTWLWKTKIWSEAGVRWMWVSAWAGQHKSCEQSWLNEGSWARIGWAVVAMVKVRRERWCLDEGRQQIGLSSCVQASFAQTQRLKTVGQWFPNWCPGTPAVGYKQKSHKNTTCHYYSTAMC